MFIQEFSPNKKKMLSDYDAVLMYYMTLYNMIQIVYLQMLKLSNFKLFDYFYVYTVCVKKFKEFYELANIQYQDIKIKEHRTKTRWLSLLLAIDTIILMFDSLKIILSFTRLKSKNNS